MKQVKFLYEKDGESVFAFFADTPYTVDEGVGGLFTCYAPIGQHSACHVDYANECKEAPYSEYVALLKELIGQGYNDLKILNKQEIEAHRPPTQGEIKFGEGATHWLTVDLPHILNKKGDIKQWFVFPKDGLRYYTT